MSKYKVRFKLRGALVSGITLLPGRRLTDPADLLTSSLLLLNKQNGRN